MGEPITNGLRSYLYDAMVEMPSCLKRAFSFCDSIDAIHASLEQENERLQEKLDNAYNSVDDSYDSGYNVGYAAGKGSSDFTTIDNWLAKREDAMTERGWIKLPVDAEAPSKQLADWIERRGLVTGPLDANGELWHSGDMSDSNWGVIEGICFDNGVWFISGHDISAPWIPADSIAHYHPDTWERIIEDAREYRLNIGGSYLWKNKSDELVARCKALAGEDE